MGIHGVIGRPFDFFSFGRKARIESNFLDRYLRSTPYFDLVPDVELPNCDRVPDVALSDFSDFPS